MAENGLGRSLEAQRCGILQYEERASSARRAEMAFWTHHLRKGCVPPGMRLLAGYVDNISHT
jgi:hypothetical protein